jgi:hypothetical protein
VSFSEGLPTHFKGYVEITKAINDRLFKSPGSFDFKRYLGGEGTTDLSPLLGVYEGEGVDGGFRNGAPNATNMFLWYYSLSSFAKSVASACTRSPEPMVEGLNATFLSAVKAFSAWPEASARSDEAFLGLWRSTMGYDAPDSEFEAWKEFFRGPGYAGATPPALVRELLVSVLMNPHFLLRK